MWSVSECTVSLRIISRCLQLMNCNCVRSDVSWVCGGVDVESLATYYDY